MGDAGVGDPVTPGALPTAPSTPGVLPPSTPPFEQPARGETTPAAAASATGSRPATTAVSEGVTATAGAALGSQDSAQPKTRVTARATQQDGGTGGPATPPSGPLQNALSLVTAGGTSAAGTGGAAPGAIALLGGIAFAIIFLVGRRRLAADLRVPGSPYYLLDCTPD